MQSINKILMKAKLKNYKKKKTKKTKRERARVSSWSEQPNP